MVYDGKSVARKFENCRSIYFL